MPRKSQLLATAAATPPPRGHADQKRSHRAFRGTPPPPTFDFDALADSTLLNEYETAQVLRVSMNTLSTWRSQRRSNDAADAAPRAIDGRTVKVAGKAERLATRSPSAEDGQAQRAFQAPMGLAVEITTTRSALNFLPWAVVANGIRYRVADIRAYMARPRTRKFLTPPRRPRRATDSTLEREGASRG